jgi:hypothetical protein
MTTLVANTESGWDVRHPSHILPVPMPRLEQGYEWHVNTRGTHDPKGGGWYEVGVYRSAYDKKKAKLIAKGRAYTPSSDHSGFSFAVERGSDRALDTKEWKQRKPLPAKAASALSLPVAPKRQPLIKRGASSVLRHTLLMWLVLHAGLVSFGLIFMDQFVPVWGGMLAFDVVAYTAVTIYQTKKLEYNEVDIDGQVVKW